MIASYIRIVGRILALGTTTEVVGWTFARWRLRVINRHSRHSMSLSALSGAMLNDIGLDQPALSWALRGMEHPSRTDHHI